MVLRLMKNIFNGIPAEFFIADIPRPSNFNMTEIINSPITENSITSESNSQADMNLIESSNNTESLTSLENSISNKTNVSLMENSNPQENVTSSENAIMMGNVIP